MTDLVVSFFSTTVLYYVQSTLWAIVFGKIPINRAYLPSFLNLNSSKQNSNDNLCISYFVIIASIIVIRTTMYRKPSHPHRRSQRRSYDHYGPQNRRPRNLNLGFSKPSNRGRWNNGSSGSWVPTNSKNPGWSKRSSGGSWGSSQHNNAGWQKGSTRGSWGHFYVVNSDLLKSSAGESSLSSNAKDARVKCDYAKGNTPLPLDLLDQKKKTLLNSMSQEPFKPKEDSEVEVVKVVCRPQPIVITPMERVEIRFRHEKEALTRFSFSVSVHPFSVFVFSLPLLTLHF